jgi:large subunit ribosomal protein L20
MKALRYSYVGRKQKKRFFRKLWITRINAASRYHNKLKVNSPRVSYSHLISSFKKNQINLNRKMLAQLAILDPSTFAILSEIATKSVYNTIVPKASTNRSF